MTWTGRTVRSDKLEKWMEEEEESTSFFACENVTAPVYANEKGLSLDRLVSLTLQTDTLTNRKAIFIGICAQGSFPGKVSVSNTRCWHGRFYIHTSHSHHLNMFPSICSISNQCWKLPNSLYSAGSVTLQTSKLY